MKKYLSVFMAIITVILCATFASCSCTGSKTLTFTETFNGEKTPVVGTKETSVYTVSYDPEFVLGDNDFKKSKSFREDFSCDFNGLYTVETEVIDKTSIEETCPAKTSEIIKNYNTLFKISTSLSVKATYGFDGKTQTFDDTMTSFAYFCRGENSFAPVYAKNTYDYHVCYYNGTPSYTRLIGENETVYGLDKYSVKNVAFNDNGEILEDKTDSYSYELNTLLDNTALLFALRNVNIEYEQKTYLPVVNPSYGKKAEIVVGYFINSTEKLTGIKYNGTTKDLEIPAKCYSYAVNDANASGTPQITFIQKSAVGETENRSLMVKYVTPVSTFGNFNQLGAIIYTLNEINFS